MSRADIMTKQQLKAIKALRDVMREFDIEIFTTASRVILWIGNDRIDVKNGSYLEIKHLERLIQEYDSEK